MSNDQDAFREIFSDIIKWIGFIIAVISFSGLFVSSEWLVKPLYETINDYGSNDSEASSLLYKLEIELLNIASWLKGLPTGYKVSGIMIGGLLIVIGSLIED
jgi:hypothetical protein